MALAFADSAGRLRVGFSQPALETFASHLQVRFWHSERGGVLLASSFGASDGFVEIMRVTPPHQDDRAGRHWLKINHTRVLQEINHAFEGGLHFVGYWHTHPQARPLLSSQDVVALTPALRGFGLDLQRILMVVVGGPRIAPRLDVCAVDCATGAWDRLAPDTATGSHGVATDVEKDGH